MNIVRKPTFMINPDVLEKSIKMTVPLSHVQGGANPLIRRYLDGSLAYDYVVSKLVDIIDKLTTAKANNQKVGTCSPEEKQIINAVFPGMLGKTQSGISTTGLRLSKEEKFILAHKTIASYQTPIIRTEVVSSVGSLGKSLNALDNRLSKSAYESGAAAGGMFARPGGENVAAAGFQVAGDAATRARSEVKKKVVERAENRAENDAALARTRDAYAKNAETARPQRQQAPAEVFNRVAGASSDSSRGSSSPSGSTGLSGTPASSGTVSKPSGKDAARSSFAQVAAVGRPSQEKFRKESMSSGSDSRLMREINHNLDEGRKQNDLILEQSKQRAVLEKVRKESPEHRISATSSMLKESSKNRRSLREKNTGDGSKVESDFPELPDKDPMSGRRNVLTPSSSEHRQKQRRQSISTTPERGQVRTLRDVKKALKSSAIRKPVQSPGIEQGHFIRNPKTGKIRYVPLDEWLRHQAGGDRKSSL